MGFLLVLVEDGADACIAHDLQEEMGLSEQLRQSEAEIQRICEDSPIGIVKADIQGLPLASNRKFRGTLAG
jgi:PAS domain-containing protein